MQMLTEICRKTEWSLSFSYEKTVTEGKTEADRSSV